MAEAPDYGGAELHTTPRWGKRDDGVRLAEAARAIEKDSGERGITGYCLGPLTRAIRPSPAISVRSESGAHSTSHRTVL